MDCHPPLSRTACALLFVATALAACSGSRSLSDLPSQEVTGYYTANSDGKWFQPCSATDEDELWWVTFTEHAVEQREVPPFADLLRSDQPVFVRWRAALGDREVGDPDGPGPGTRYALVREIVEIRPKATGDCVAP